MIARQQGRKLTEIATAAGVPMLGASSVTDILSLDLEHGVPVERGGDCGVVGLSLSHELFCDTANDA